MDYLTPCQQIILSFNKIPHTKRLNIPANAENWSYTKANLLPGRRYFIKANIFPGVLYGRVALNAVPKTDSRIEKWLSNLHPMRASPSDKETRESEKQSEIRTAVKEFKEGKVTSFGELHPEDGQ